jgi:hypothetical protein
MRRLRGRFGCSRSCRELRIGGMALVENDGDDWEKNGR